MGIAITVGYATMLLYLDQFIFFAPYFTIYVPVSSIASFAFDLTLSPLTCIVLAVSVRQIILQRKSSGASKTGLLGVIAGLVAGACPCYYLPSLTAVAGVVGGTVATIGILLNSIQLPIKTGATLILLLAIWRLEKTGVCRVRAD